MLPGIGETTLEVAVSSVLAIAVSVRRSYARAATRAFRGGLILAHDGLRRIHPCTHVQLAWLWTNHWMLNNILGVALVVAFVAIGRVPSGRVAAILLLGLLAYDVFWVRALNPQNPGACPPAHTLWAAQTAPTSHADPFPRVCPHPARGVLPTGLPVAAVLQRAERHGGGGDADRVQPAGPAGWRNQRCAPGLHVHRPGAPHQAHRALVVDRRRRLHPRYTPTLSPLRQPRRRLHALTRTRDARRAGGQAWATWPCRACC